MKAIFIFFLALLIGALASGDEVFAQPPDIQIISAETDLSAPCSPGEIFTFTTPAAGENLRYRFYSRAGYGTESWNSNKWEVVQEWSSISWFNYTFPSPGNYYIIGHVVTEGENWRVGCPQGGFNVVCSGDTQIINVTTDLTSSPEVGQTFCFTVDVVKPEEVAIHYQFYYRAGYGTVAWNKNRWTVVREWGPMNEFDYRFDEPGNYYLVAQVVPAGQKWETGDLQGGFNTIVGSGLTMICPAPLSAAAFHTVAVKDDGTLWTWGGNQFGQLGDGTKINRAAPVQVFGLSDIDIIGLTAGDTHTVALKDDGTVTSWGNNGFGQLGDGTTTSSTSPVPVAGLSNVTMIASKSLHTLALKSNGTVWAWGLNLLGRLGDGTTTNRAMPVQVVGLGDALAVSGGEAHSIALKSDGTVWVWGGNLEGQLGDGTLISRSTPVQVVGLTEIKAVSAGGLHSLALKADGTVWSWGSNASGQLGDGTGSQRRVPVQVNGITNIAAIAGGGDHSLALRGDGTVWAWGLNETGQLGDGTTENRSLPVQVVGLSGIVAIAGGFDHSLAIHADGTIWAWGNNNSGQLGDGTILNRYTPTQVTGLYAW